ncbi:MAG: hypothetical protein QW158_03190 [Nitrososphaerales archaeon]
MKKGLSALSVVLLILLVLSSGLSVYFYLDSVDVKSRYNYVLSELRGVAFEVDLLIDYGNGSLVWHNNTLLPIGSSLLNATLKVSRSVEYLGSDMGVFVNGIDGVGTKVVQKGHYWIWWRFDKEKGEWTIGETAADQYMIKQGDILAWLYEDTSNYPNLRKPAGR